MALILVISYILNPVLNRLVKPRVEAGFGVGYLHSKPPMDLENNSNPTQITQNNPIMYIITLIGSDLHS